MTEERQGAIMVSKELSVGQKLSSPLFFFIAGKGGGGEGRGAKKAIPKVKIEPSCQSECKIHFIFAAC